MLECYDAGAVADVQGGGTVVWSVTCACVSVCSLTVRVSFTAMSGKSLRQISVGKSGTGGGEPQSENYE